MLVGLCTTDIHRWTQIIRDFHKRRDRARPVLTMSNHQNVNNKGKFQHPHAKNEESKLVETQDIASPCSILRDIRNGVHHPVC